VVQCRTGPLVLLPGMADYGLYEHTGVLYISAPTYVLCKLVFSAFLLLLLSPSVHPFFSPSSPPPPLSPPLSPPPPFFARYLRMFPSTSNQPWKLDSVWGDARWPHVECIVETVECV
jgi:hypothetical protein